MFRGRQQLASLMVSLAATSCLSLARAAPPDKAFQHEETGTVFPTQIEGLTLSKIRHYEKAAAGVSLRYEGPPGVHADVYIYHRGRDEIVAEPGQREEIAELQATMMQLHTLAQNGAYADVQSNGQARVRAFGGDSLGTLSVVVLPVSYRSAAAVGEPISEEPLHSTIAIAVFRHHFFKLRYTFSSQLDRSVWEANRTRFIDDFGKLIQETRLQAELKNNLAIYEKEPLSKKGRDAASFLIGYAEASALIQITVATDDSPWMKLEGLPEEAKLDLFRALVIGNLREQWRTLKFESQRLAGVTEAIGIYRRLRQQDSIPALTRMDEFDKWERAGTLAEQLAAGDGPQDAP